MENLGKHEQELIKKYGFMTHYVFGGPNENVNIHTHGVQQTYGHPDFQIVIPMSQQTAHHILSIAVEHVKNGFKYESGKEYDNLIENSPKYTEKKFLVKVLAAKEGERDVLRLIFPDKEGNYDSPGMFARQFDGTK